MISLTDSTDILGNLCAVEFNNPSRTCSFPPNSSNKVINSIALSFADGRPLKPHSTIATTTLSAIELADDDDEDDEESKKAMMHSKHLSNAIAFTSFVICSLVVY